MAAFLLGSQLWLTACSYLVVLVLARSLGPELYGVYGIVYSVLLSVELIGRLGLPQALTKLVAEAGAARARVEASGFTLSMALYAAIFAAFWLGAPVLAAVFNVTDGTRLFRIASLDIPFCGAYFVLMHVLTGRHAFAAQAAGTVVYATSKAIGILVLAYIGPSVEGALIVNIAGSIAGLAAVVAFVGKDPFVPTMREAAPLMQLAVPVAVISLSTQVLINVDLWMLNALGTSVSAAVKGDYVAAGNVARIPNVVAFALVSMLVPMVARYLSEQAPDRAAATIEGSLRFMSFVLLPSAAIVAVNGSEILTLLFSPAYAEGSRLLGILIFGQGVAFTVYMTLANVLIATGQAGASARLSVVVVILATLLAALLVAFAGAVGAAWSSLLANCTAVAAVVLVLRARLALHMTLWDNVRVVAISAVVAALGWWFEAEGPMLLVELTLLAGLTLLLLMAAGLVSRTEIESFLPARWRRLSVPPPAA